MNREVAPITIIPRSTRREYDKVTLTAFDMDEGDIVLMPSGGWLITKSWKHHHDYGNVTRISLEKYYLTGDETEDDPDLGDLEYWTLPDSLPITFYQHNRPKKGA